jgi:CheY-specific phosphatase CheX
VDLVPKHCLRVASLHVKVSSGEPLEEVPDLRYRVSVSMRGVSALEVALSGDRDFALPLASATAGLDPENCDEELVEDGLGEFLHVVAGNALTVVASEGVRSHLSPPDLGAWPAKGYAFEIIATQGHGILVMAPISVLLTA